MHRFSQTASDVEILALVEDWAQLLAEERYDEALELIPAGGHWTSDSLRAVISGYGLPEPHPS